MQAAIITISLLSLALLAVYQNHHYNVWKAEQEKQGDIELRLLAPEIDGRHKAFRDALLTSNNSKHKDLPDQISMTLQRLSKRYEE